MELSTLISHLTTTFHHPLFRLPGEQAQFKMVPKGREKFISPSMVYQPSAVLIYLFPDHEGKTHISILRRTVYPGHHSGQLALPGGKFEPEDRNIIQTAIRETKEEIGISIDSQQVIGRLSPLAVPISNFEITPVVAYSHNVPDFILDPVEVDQLYLLPIQKLIQAPVLSGNFESKNNLQIHAPYYAIDDLKIWGATAMILAEFIHIITK